MRNDIRELITCDAIWMMPGWPKSKGATLEFQIRRAPGNADSGYVLGGQLCSYGILDTSRSRSSGGARVRFHRLSTERLFAGMTGITTAGLIRESAWL